MTPKPTETPNVTQEPTPTPEPVATTNPKEQEAVEAVNKAHSVVDMIAALNNPDLGLDLQLFHMAGSNSSAQAQSRAILSLIYERPQETGYPDKAAIQSKLDEIIKRQVNIGPDEVLPEPVSWTMPPQDPNFFPLGVWLQDPARAKEFKEIGINTYVALWRGLNQTALDTLKAADMKLVAEMNEFALKYIKENPDDKTIIAWMKGDEPDNAQDTGDGWGPPIDPASIIIKYNEIRSLDNTRPVQLNLGRGVAYNDWVGRGIDKGKDFMYPQYVKGADIVTFDIYPANSQEEEVLNQLWYVAKGVENLVKWTNNEKPVWAYIETSNIDGFNRPTPEQIKSEVWMAIIHGADGIGYFLHEFSPQFYEAGLLDDPKNATNKEMVASVNKQITELAPVINSPNTEGYAEVESSNAEIPIAFMTKEYDGGNYIFAVSMREGETTGTFKVASGKNVEVLGEDRTIKITSNQFKDKFGPYEVHIYKITD